MSIKTIALLPLLFSSPGLVALSDLDLFNAALSIKNEAVARSAFLSLAQTSQAGLAKKGFKNAFGKNVTDQAAPAPAPVQTADPNLQQFIDDDNAVDGFVYVMKQGSGKQLLDNLKTEKTKVNATLDEIKIS